MVKTPQDFRPYAMVNKVEFGSVTSGVKRLQTAGLLEGEGAKYLLFGIPKTKAVIKIEYKFVRRK